MGRWPVAMEAVWSIAAALPGLVIVESWWFRPRDLGYARAGLDRCTATAVVELWSDVPPDLARRRYAARRRHPVHEDRQRLVLGAHA